MKAKDQTIPSEPVAAGGWRTHPAAAHAVPFLAWIVIMGTLGRWDGGEGWKYALRAAVCLGLLCACRPWRWYAPLRVRNLPLALAVGVAVCVVWVFFDTPWGGRWPRLQAAYLNWAVLPLGRLPEAVTASPYAPEVCGWPLTLARLLGSALVISAAEEFFWRGFVYRWFIAEKFLEVDPGCWKTLAAVSVSLAFGLEHREWLAGWIAGMAYLALFIRTRDIWAAIAAHAITNFLLGLYVLACGAYAFW